MNRKTATEILQYLDALREEELTREEAAQLEVLLTEDREARQFFIQASAMSANLAWLYRLEDGERALATDFSAREPANVVPIESARGPGHRMETAGGGNIDFRRPRQSEWRDWVKAGIAAAAAALVAVLAMRAVKVDDGATIAVSASPVPLEAALQFVGRVSWQHDVKVGPETTISVENGWLSAGRLHLLSGLMEITFDSGAQATLEGPCVFDLERPNRGYLQSGKLTAYVPRQAVGFVVNTPQINIVDLGTRFAVEVGSGGESEIHVIEGEVEATRTSGMPSPVLVTAGMAIRSDNRSRADLDWIAYDGDRFYQALSDLPPDNLAFAHYAFDEAAGSILEDQGRRLEGSPFDFHLDQNGDLELAPKRTGGRFGSGLVFNGVDSQINPMFSCRNGLPPKTVSFWVRVPPKAEPKDAGGIIGWRTGDSGPVWQVGWNTDATQGAVGAARIDVGDGYVIGSTDLRDGRWHHVALIFIGSSEGADIGTHVLHYVDGSLETLTGYGPASLADEPAGATQAALGRSLDPAKPSQYFRGWIDEVYFFDSALTPADIFELNARNEIPRKPVE